MSAFTPKKDNKTRLTLSGLSFDYLMAVFFVIEVGLIITLSSIILERFDTTTFYELLVVVLVLFVLVFLMIRNHLTQKARAEKSIEKSGKEVADFKHALDASAIVAITNQKGTITYVNDNFCSISKYSREELIGQDHRIINSGQHSQAFFRSLWVTIANGRIWKGELRNKAKDGSLYWVDTTIVPFLNEAGKPYQYLSVRFDITERKRMEESLRETEANLKTVFENTENAYILMNSKLEIVAFNPRAEQFSINSLGKEGRIGEYVIDYFPQDRKAKMTKYMKEVLTGRKIHYEISYRQPDGHMTWYDVSLYPVSKNKRNYYGLIMEMADITIKKKAEVDLRQSQANLMAIIQNTDASIYSIDNACRYITFNKAHSDALKLAYNLDIKPGDHVYDFLEKLAPEEIAGWQEIYNRAFEGDILKFEKEFEVNGSICTISFSIYPIWESQLVIGLSCFALDISEEKKAQLQKKKMTQDLIQRNKDLEQFSYIISHNLRGPVANILGLANVIKCANLNEQEQAKTRGYLFQAVEKLDEIVHDLSITINTKRNINEIKEEIILSEIVENIKGSIKNYIQNEQVEISTDFSAFNKVYSIKSYFHNIFYNLISNSIKYAQPGKLAEIHIKSERVGDKLLLHFCDNGVGIDIERHKDKLFGLYHRFHNQSEGKGMGLFMVKTQVETLGGSIRLNSEVNKGTEFILEFDLPKEAVSRPELV